MANDFDSINEMTGFANGTEFSNDAEVRAYFTVENMKLMFDDDGVKDQAELDEMAATVIWNRWHMVAFVSK